MISSIFCVLFHLTVVSESYQMYVAGPCTSEELNKIINFLRNERDLSEETIDQFSTKGIQL